MAEEIAQEEGRKMGGLKYLHFHFFSKRV